VALNIVAVLKRLGVSIETNSPPITEPGVISWLGRIYDVTPSQYNLGMIEGMEIWSTGLGFAPLDLVGVETWLFDAPRGSHLIVAEREVNFQIGNTPTRDGRTVKIWELDDFAAFIGHAVIDGRLTIIEEDTKEENLVEENLFDGPGPFVLKPKNDFSALDSKGLDISMSKPVLIPARLHNVRGFLRGPAEEEIQKWILNCGGLHILQGFELLSRPPMLNHDSLPIAEEPDFFELLSERRPHSEGMGDLLHWWKFDSETEFVETYDVFVPAHKGQDAIGKKWILDGVTSKLHLNH